MQKEEWLKVHQQYVDAEGRAWARIRVLLEQERAAEEREDWERSSALQAEISRVDKEKLAAREAIGQMLREGWDPPTGKVARGT